MKIGDIITTKLGAEIRIEILIKHPGSNPTGEGYKLK